jgi:hypothetical protein
VRPRIPNPQAYFSLRVPRDGEIRTKRPRDYESGRSDADSSRT